MFPVFRGHPCQFSNTLQIKYSDWKCTCCLAPLTAEVGRTPYIRVGCSFMDSEYLLGILNCRTHFNVELSTNKLSNVHPLQGDSQSKDGEILCCIPYFQFTLTLQFFFIYRILILCFRLLISYSHSPSKFFILEPYLSFHSPIYLLLLDTLFSGNLEPMSP
jgi:hypothetical protein